MYYIFCNSNFKNAVAEIPLTSAKQMYFVNNPNSSVQDYEVWELTDSDYNLLDKYEDEYYSLSDSGLIWKESWGWWRWCEGACYSVESSPTHVFTVNDNNIELYYDEIALKNYTSCILEDITSEDYWPIDEIPENIKKTYFVEFAEFTDIFDYCSRIWCVSTEKNRVALIVANAKLNNIPVHEFMQKVVG